MSVRERQYVIWGIKLDKEPDYDELVEETAYDPKYKARENVGHFRLLSQMDGDPCYLGYVWDAADSYEGEGLSKVGPLPSTDKMWAEHKEGFVGALKHFDQDISGAAFRNGWYVFTQYS